MEKNNKEEKNQETTKKIEDKVKEVLNTEDSTKNFDQKDIDSGKIMGVLCYIFAPVPYFIEKDNKFVLYHAKIGMNLFIISVIYTIISTVLKNVIQINYSCWGIPNCYKATPWWVSWPLDIISALLAVLAIIGIVYVLTGKAKELPIIDKLKIIK